MKQWDGSDKAVRSAGFEDTEFLLREGFAAGAVIDDQVVSIILTSALTRRFADVGGHTLEPYRRRGYAAAALSMVAEKVQERGLTPIWSVGETNLASRGVAKKVGFEDGSGQPTSFQRSVMSSRSQTRGPSQGTVPCGCYFPSLSFASSITEHEEDRHRNRPCRRQRTDGEGRE
ncbi:MAG: GNAT family N-acetyltransferase [Thermoplasmata archaeon]